MPDLSIIIPIYNTPKNLLQRCFDSLNTVNGVELEVILSDDGSRETIGAFCQEYVRQHSNFHYFHKKNGGVSSARNAGIARAQGRYIAFLDADDELLGQCITKHLIDENPELVIFDILLDTNNAQSSWHALDVPPGKVSTSVLLEQMIVSKSMNSPCGKLFSRELIEKYSLRFNTDFITGEDWLFVYNYILHIKNACYQRENAQIYYRDGATSLSRMSRFPDQMLSNLETIYQHQLSLCNMDWAAEKRDALRSAATEQWLEHLFNLAADLTLLRKFTADRRTRICQAAKEVSAQLIPCVSKKTRSKATILLHFPIVIAPVACIRRLYLKLKR